MPTFSGRFQYLEETGAAAQSGSCRVTIEQEKLLLIPEKGPQLALDLGDIDAFSPADYQLSLKVYSGTTILLSQFGKTYQNLCHDLLEAYRGRLVQCLLLEDLEETAHFDANAQLDSAERTSQAAPNFAFTRVTSPSCPKRPPDSSGDSRISMRCISMSLPTPWSFDREATGSY